MEVAILTISSAASDANIVKMTFLFQWTFGTISLPKTNADLSNGPFRIFSFKRMYLKMISVKQWLFCSELHVLRNLFAFFHCLWWFWQRSYCPACRTTLIATRFWVVMICPIIKCLTVLEFSFILFDLCLFITIFNFILNYVPIVTFWIFTYHKIWILLINFCFIWSYWIIYFLTCLEVFWSVVS